MIRDLLKWVAPGLVTVLCGTTLSLAMTSADIATDLSTRSQAAMDRDGYDWAELALNGRDLVLSGTTTDTAIVEAATTRLANLSGIRSVASDVTLAPLASPYTLVASIEGNAIALDGGIPNEFTRQRLLALVASAQDSMQLRSGMPQRRIWTSGAEFAIDQLQYLDQGQVSISDLTVDIVGRARSERAFRDLLIVMRAGAPSGVTLGRVEITPALVTPYQWSAAFDGKRIEVSGFVPNDALAERFRTADVGGLPVATGLALASGEPVGFADLSSRLLEQLATLEYGSATITDGRSTLVGAPASIEIAQAVVETLQPSGTIVTLEPPRIADYWMSATRQSGGVTVFDGYAPDEATRQDLAQRDGADVTWLKLGRGAPERYQSAVDFGLAALDRMSEGRIALRDLTLTISGTARSSADYEALLAAVVDRAPQGVTLAPAEIVAPRASLFTWSVYKEAGGRLTLTGMVPSPSDKLALTGRAGQSATQTMTYASGAPVDFLASAETALDLMQWVGEGQIAYDGTGWTITGIAGSAVDKSALEADFITRRLASAGWSMAVAEPAPTIPSISPYLWSATHAAGGVSLMGHVPTENLRNYLAVRAGTGVMDKTAIGLGAPDGFILSAPAGLDAILALDEGEVSFDGKRWTLNGYAASLAERDATLAALAAAVDIAAWSISISAPEPVVAQLEPEVAVPVAAEVASTPQVDPDYAFSASRAADGAVILSGQVPSDPALRYFGTISNGDSAAVSIADGAPASFLSSAEIGLRALLGLSEGRLDFAGGAWSLTGLAADEAAREAIRSAIAADSGTTWNLAVDLPPPPSATAPAAVVPVPTAPEPADIAACSAPVNEFSARNSILFQSGSALIAAESEAALDELAIDLAACPDAIVHIEGHTDSDGDEALNMALSVARAEAVVEGLIARGVTPARLYAVGYGETAPIADNATAQGKGLNRRIIVTVRPERY